MSTSPEQLALDTLLEWATEHRDRWPDEPMFERTLRATFASATKTCRAAALLTAAGFGPEALRLGRSLLETTIVSYWMVHKADHDWAVARMREHLLFNDVVLIEALERHDWPSVPYPQAKRDEVEADRLRLSKLYGRHAETGWWERDLEQNDKGNWKVADTRSLRTLAAELVGVEELEGRLWQLEDGEATETPLLGQMLDIPQRLNNQFVHHNPAGLANYADLDDKGEFVFDDGPSTDWVREAQFFLYVCYALLVQLMLDRHTPELREDFETSCDAAFLRAYVPLSPEVQKEVKKGRNRNKLCPCGGGWKTKRCHGAPE